MTQPIQNHIDKAATRIGKTWPLYSFVASNPLSGYEHQPFVEAVTQAKKYLNANPYPSARVFKNALDSGSIQAEILSKHLKQANFLQNPEAYIKLMEAQQVSAEINPYHQLDRISVKWLAAFLDEGLAEWTMPYRSEGFYTAWRLVVVYDSELGKTELSAIPKTAEAALEEILAKYSEAEKTAIATQHLAALPGWTGYINHRSTSGSDWQKDYPLSLTHYLAARLWMCQKLRLPLLTRTEPEDTAALVPQLKHLWLQAWEESWQTNLVKTIKPSPQAEKTNDRPEAQLVFCIDTRSEAIRRHVEAVANYETFGYAGFFGIAMDYKNPENGINRKSCPPIVDSAYLVSETAKATKTGQFENYKKRVSQNTFKNYFLKRMKNMLPSAFGFVEGSGIFYGISLMARTLLPASLYKARTQQANEVESCCDTVIHKNTAAPLLETIPLAEKVGIVKSAFDLMGWRTFAPLVIFVGHGSHSANNAFASSLDCGACAASPGRHNARMLAELANLPEVRNALAQDHNINIPQDTVFIGAEHNTTTDAIKLFDAQVSGRFTAQLQALKSKLKRAQLKATQQRFPKAKNSLNSAHKKANNWSETRPEWGLSKNAGFIIGSRELTKDTDLDGQCFLHSYDYKLDPAGEALEGIMKGPMTVTQWINNHYYFSTVDNATYGGGSKITHNITGKFGVVQGNGGDLKMGLPLQSLQLDDEQLYHNPIRLSVLIQAPVSRVTQILTHNPALRELLDNSWIYLMVMDPEHNDQVFKYQKDLNFTLFNPAETAQNEPIKEEAVTR